MNLRDFIEAFVGLNTERELDLTVGGVEVKGTVKTERIVEKE